MRSGNSIKNFFAGIAGQMLTLILGFVSRRLFLVFLSVDYLGVSGLFSSILTMLSFAELGVGTAIVYSLYKPLAENNKEEIVAIMNLFKRIYRIIGIVVFAAGMAFTPFLDFFITDRKGIENLEIIYILFVIQTASSYFFTYNRTLITADQKAYRLWAIDYIYKLLHILLPIVGLAITRNYIVYLSIQIVTTIIWNSIVYIKVRYEYPILKESLKPKIKEETKHSIFKNTTALMIYKVAIVVTSGTDNLLITRFFGIEAVGFCANYTLIIQNVTSLLSQGINAITASIGNLSSTGSDDKKHQIFNVIFFVNFWIYSFVSIGLLFCINPLIRAVFGAKYVVDYSIYLPMIVSFFLLGMQSPTSVFRDAQGLFWQGKFRPIAQTIINLGSSIALAKLTNNVGAIFWGTALSRLLTNFWYDPYIVHKHGFHKPLMPYFIKYGKYVLEMLVTCGVSFLAINYISVSNAWLELIVKAVTCTVIVNLLFFIMFMKSAEFKYLKSTLLSNIKILRRG